MAGFCLRQQIDDDHKPAGLEGCETIVNSRNIIQHTTIIMVESYDFL
jgi:hypothetical protein